MNMRLSVVLPIFVAVSLCYDNCSAAAVLKSLKGESTFSSLLSRLHSRVKENARMDSTTSSRLWDSTGRILKALIKMATSRALKRRSGRLLSTEEPDSIDENSSHNFRSSRSNMRGRGKVSFASNEDLDDFEMFLEGAPESRSPKWPPAASTKRPHKHSHKGSKHPPPPHRENKYPVRENPPKAKYPPREKISNKDKYSQRNPVYPMRDSPVKEKYPVREKSPPKERYPVREKNPPKEKYPVREKDPPKEKYPVREKNPPKEKYPVRETPVKEKYPMRENPVNEKYPVKEKTPIKEKYTLRGNPKEKYSVRDKVATKEKEPVREKAPTKDKYSEKEKTPAKEKNQVKQSYSPMKEIKTKNKVSIITKSSPPKYYGFANPIENTGVLESTSMIRSQPLIVELGPGTTRDGRRLQTVEIQGVKIIVGEPKEQDYFSWHN